jgi:putative Ca2+/H+ antiporter (TMEM165/GDT1 family)
LESLWISFAVIFVAEVGDKSQLMTLAFATRYRPWPVLGAVAVATMIMTGVSVLAGGLLGAVLPTEAVSLAAGLAFFGFAAWTLRGGPTGHDEVTTVREHRYPMLAVAITFLLAELGDKTMLATATLASTEGWLGTWVGATLGMVGANGVAIIIGHQLGERIPEWLIRIGSATAFAAFGLWLLLVGFGVL